MTLVFHANRAGTREPARRRVHQRPPAAKPHPPQGTDHAHKTTAKCSDFMDPFLVLYIFIHTSSPLGNVEYRGRHMCAVPSQDHRDGGGGGASLRHLAAAARQPRMRLQDTQQIPRNRIHTAR